MVRGQIKPYRDWSTLDVQQATPPFHMAVHCKFQSSQVLKFSMFEICREVSGAMSTNM